MDNQKIARARIPHECRMCGVTFMSIRIDAKYCSDNCRKAFSRWRQKLTKKEHTAIALMDEIAAYLSYDITRGAACEVYGHIQARIDSHYKRNKIVRVR